MIRSAKLLTCYSNDHIKVHFSDYACIDVVPLRNLRELPITFRLLPEQAIQAKLYGKLNFFYFLFSLKTFLFKQIFIKNRKLCFM